jgi:8-amino-7-oxononanoate synthase
VRNGWGERLKSRRRGYDCTLSAFADTNDECFDQIERRMGGDVRPDGRESMLDADLGARLAELERAGLRRVMRGVERGAGAEIRIDGTGAVDFSSNDYLGLAADPRIAQAAARALAEAGTGVGAARLISGNHPLHERLEREIAAFEGAPAALLFASGYAANTSAGMAPVLAAATPSTATR